MSNGLKIVNDLLKYMEEYANKTGNEAAITISKAVLEEIQSDLQRLDVIDNANGDRYILSQKQSDDIKIKDCIDCKYSFYEDLDYNLCCKLKNNQILRGVLDEEFKDCIPHAYDYKYPNTCENFESYEEDKSE